LHLSYAAPNAIINESYRDPRGDEGQSEDLFDPQCHQLTQIMRHQWRGPRKLGPMVIKLLIFARLEKLANPVAMEDARFESEDSRFSLKKKFFHPPA
jgi:hypothetical protein